MYQEWATVDSKKLEYGSGMIYAGFPSYLGFGIGGCSYSNFLVCTVVDPQLADKTEL